MKCKNPDCKKKAKEYSKYCEYHEIIEYYYNPNVPCTCEAIFADTHRDYCKRRSRRSAEEWLKKKEEEELK